MSEERKEKRGKCGGRGQRVGAQGEVDVGQLLISSYTFIGGGEGSSSHQHLKTY